MDHHGYSQEGWALRYEQMSHGRFASRLQQVHLPEMTLLREDTNIALHQRGQLDSDAYGFATALTDTADLFVNGRQVAFRIGAFKCERRVRPPNATDQSW